MTDVTVLLGSRFDALEHHGTRWRALLTRWAADPSVERLDVVDFPRFRVGPARAVSSRSWLPGAQVVSADVPGHRTVTGAWDRLGWRACARALERELGGRPDRVVIAATPLWAPLLPHLPAGRRCFDAVDDWRGLASVRHLRRRVDAGYRAAAGADACTSVTAVLADRLGRDFGVRAQVVPNGVDLQAFSDGAAAPAGLPAGLPAGRFAVYVGSVQERVDVGLIAAVAGELPVVVAGPADAGAAAALTASGATWLGPVDVALVPGLLLRASVGLLPHRVDDFTASMDPMKLLEYLAAGLPVVATPLPGVAVSERVVMVEPGPAFVREVRRLLAEPRPDAPDPAVQGRDWDGVAARLLGIYRGDGRC
ncbi:MAG: glycosyltransferase [Frankiales bacterium]|nr:MAG: glycosyltransferase [Frankiales bacterium]